MGDKESNGGGTKKDMSDDWVNKVSDLLSEIDMWQRLEADGIFYYDSETNKQSLVIDKLNNALERLETKLHAKMLDKDEMKEDLILLNTNKNKIDQIKNKILKIGKKLVLDGDIVPYYQTTPYYKQYRQLISEKQNILNYVLEKIGLTAKEIDKARRFG